ncbi:RSC8 Chromatin structure-remodeling complex protein RSC8 [Candida maltosa Xu316]|uniref:Chromatin structure-remodeling complex protein RSC8 n=1 Tax=Candida maltosa (strain Xu316) TaxID=1245528 RepID=M3K3Y5_CANMX|nr:hypothetical protein G210_5015 [Candida maltosa Xu316]
MSVEPEAVVNPTLENDQAQTTSEEKATPVIDVEKLQKDFQESARTYLADQTAHVIVPSFSKWFDMNNIHPIEIKSFPDFFKENGTGYKSPQDYKYIRDFIVNTFRLNPKEYLTITATRKNLAGDVSNIIRIHQFLEKWGLINYQIDPRTKSTVLGPQYTGHFQITLDGPQGLVPSIPENAEIINVKSETQVGTEENGNDTEKTSSSTDASLPLNLEIRRNIYSTGEKKTNYKTSTLVNYSCSICGKDATEVRYHNLKIKSYTHNPSSTINNASVLCSICYDQGLFPSNFHSSDFIQLQKNQESAEWSEQELLLLLEGIEMFGTYEPPLSNGAANISANLNGQWDKISEHVSTKTREQCIIKFIKLPIEDKFLTKLIAEEPKDCKIDDVTSPQYQTLVEDIVSRLLYSAKGPEVFEKNAEVNLKQSQLEQTDLINQVIQLTLEKFDLKLNKVDELQDNLLKLENQLNLERKQVLLERWSQFEKIEKLKKSRPELSDVLDDLIKPVQVNEVNKAVDQNKQSENQEDQMDVDENDKENNAADSTLPVSVAKPRAYQFWSG